MEGHRTLVTGAAGFVGSHLLDRLRDEGPLAAWSRLGGRQPESTAGADWHAVDLLDPEAVRRALESTRPTRVFHLAGAPSVDTSWRTVVPHLRANVLGTHHLLDAVRAQPQPCRVLVVTSAQIYAVMDEPISEQAPLHPPTPYGVSKLAQDQLALRAVTEDGLDVVVARPFNHAGPRQKPGFSISSFARQIARIERGLDPPVIRVGNLDARRDITDVRDVVAAYVGLMERAPAGRPYNVCSGRAWRIGDLLDELRQMALVPVEIEVDADRLRPNDVPVIQGDATRLRSELGWTPRIPVEHLLRDTLDWWRQQATGDETPTP